MSESQPEPQGSLQNFLGDLELPIYDVVEKGSDQTGIETRDPK